jgi:hypothetical protein
MQKLYFIKNKEGKYVSQDQKKELVKTENILNAKAFSDFLKADFLCATLEDKTFEVVQLEEEDFMNLIAVFTAQAIISCDVNRQFFEQVNYNLPTISKANKELKKRLDAASSQLKSINPFFNQIEEIAEDALYDNLSNYESVIRRLSIIGMASFAEIDAILEVYEKSPKAILGIVKKYKS